nr:hypothetical protein [Tanacetum cinerariifolium]
SSVEDPVSNPSESEGENECDLPACFTTFSNILFDAEYEFDSVDDQSLSDEDFPEEIFLNPLFEEEINSIRIDLHHFNAESDLIESLLNHVSSIIPSSSKIDSLLDEFTGELTLLKSIPPGIDETDYHPENEIHEVIKSSIEDLVPIPSKSEGENGCDVPSCFTTFSNILFDDEYKFDSVDDQSLLNEDFSEKIFSNPLFEEEISSIKKNQHHFNAESDLVESMLNHDSSIISSFSKIDSLLDEFAGELTLLKSIPPGVDETDCYPENENRFSERLLYDNSSPRHCCMTIHLLVHQKNLILKILMLKSNL